MPWKTANLVYNHVEAWNWETLNGGPGLVLEDALVFVGGRCLRCLRARSVPFRAANRCYCGLAGAAEWEV